jgi:hypothetical protein
MKRTPTIIQYNQIRNLSMFEDVPFDFSSIIGYAGIPFNNEEENKRSFYNYKINYLNSLIITSIGKFSDCEANSNNEFYKIPSILFEYFTLSCMNQTVKNVKMGGDILSSDGELYVVGEFLKSLNDTSNGYEFGYYYPNNFFDIYNEEGYTTYHDYKIFFVNGDKMIDIKYTITKNIVRTDYNLMFNFFKPEDKVFYSSKIEMNIKDQTMYKNKLHVQFEYKLDKIENYYLRSYTKFDTVLAKIFSIFKICYFVFGGIIKIFNYGCVEYTLINNLYKFGENNQSKNDMQRERKVIVERSNDNAKKLPNIFTPSQLRKSNLWRCGKICPKSILNIIVLNILRK